MPISDPCRYVSLLVACCLRACACVMPSWSESVWVAILTVLCTSLLHFISSAIYDCRIAFIRRRVRKCLRIARTSLCLHSCYTPMCIWSTPSLMRALTKNHSPKPALSQIMNLLQKKLKRSQDPHYSQLRECLSFQGYYEGRSISNEISIGK